MLDKALLVLCAGCLVVGIAQQPAPVHTDNRPWPWHLPKAEQPLMSDEEHAAACDDNKHKQAIAAHEQEVYNKFYCRGLLCYTDPLGIDARRNRLIAVATAIGCK